MNSAGTIFYFVYVWPEPKSSAAGIRCLEMIRSLISLGYQVVVFSPARESEHSENLKNHGAETFSVDLNSSLTDSLFQKFSADRILFDRFITEEQFGWKMRELYPQALQVIDTQDLHFVRRARGAFLAQGNSLAEVANFSNWTQESSFLRELSSLFRADAAIVVSQWEQKLLRELKVPAVFWLPLFGNLQSPMTEFSSRKGLAFLGNFRHPPNFDAVQWFFQAIWPEFSVAFPRETVTLYGAYPPRSIAELKNKDRVKLVGHIADHRAALSQHLALVSPLRFGAGIKGKVLEAWGTGTPVLGTPLSVEGMGENAPIEEFSDAKSFLAGYTKLCDETHWNELSKRGAVHLQNTFDTQSHQLRLGQFLKELCAREDLVSMMLREKNANANKYFSKWIEEKTLRQGKDSLK